MAHIGRRLRKLRLEAGLTQKQLAAPRYTAAYISSIEAGKREPSRKALLYFADRLQVHPDEILTGDSPRRRTELMIELGEARRELASGTPSSVASADHRFRRLSEVARRKALVDVRARAIVGRAMCAEARNDPEGALGLYSEALELLKIESPLARVDAIVGRARVLHGTGQIAYAAFLIEQALAELRDEGLEDPSAMLRLNASLVAAYFDAGLIEQAGEASRRALELAVSVDDPERLANMNLNIGIMLAQQGHWKEAETRLAEAQHWFDELHFAVDLARVKFVRGINLRNQKRYDQARPLLMTARDSFVAAGNELRAARATVALGLLERLDGNLDEATLLLRRAITLTGQDRAVAGIAERELALCMKDRTKTIAGLRKAIRVLEGAGLAKELAATYRALGDVLSEDEDLEVACKAYRMAADLFEQAA